jgi:hypothetical protein
MSAKPMSLDLWLGAWLLPVPGWKSARQWALKSVLKSVLKSARAEFAPA